MIIYTWPQIIMYMHSLQAVKSTCSEGSERYLLEIRLQYIYVRER